MDGEVWMNREQTLVNRACVTQSLCLWWPALSPEQNLSLSVLSLLELVCKGTGVYTFFLYFILSVLSPSLPSSPLFLPSFLLQVSLSYIS